jgi:hypothetical protein
VFLRFYGPSAKQVTAGHEDVWVELEKQEDGMWTGVLPYTEPGFKQLAFSGGRREGHKSVSTHRLGQRRRYQ